MTDDDTAATQRSADGAIDSWLDAAGFIDVDLDIDDWATDDRPADEARDDPWADVTVDVPTLTDAQRRFLLGADEVAAADAEIIAIPDDPDDIAPFLPPER